MLFYLLRIAIVLVAPFFIFLKSSVYIHEHYEYPAGITIIIALIILAIILFLYVTIGYSLIFKKLGSGDALKQRLIFMFLLSAGVLFHLLFFISNRNVKSSNVKSEYNKMHPILRLATGVFTKIDKEMVMTDIARTAEDYGNMGLKENPTSLHYPQKDGYAYALDLRTKGKSKFSIAAMNWYYKILGFKTLRHVGTADHLHVALHCPKKYKR